MLELRGVSKTYGQEPATVHALAGVDLLVRGGEMVAVMGPSGSGKSTLLTIAGSLEDPTSGEVLVCGMTLAGMPRGRRARLRRRVIGYVFQDFNLLRRNETHPAGVVRDAAGGRLPLRRCGDLVRSAPCPAHRRGGPSRPRTASHPIPVWS